jgi:hypothetical protein
MTESRWKREPPRPRAGRRLVSLALLFMSVGPLPGCHKESTPKVNKATRAKVTNPAELAHKAESAKQSLAGLEPRLGALNRQFEELHRKYDTLPPALPGYGETRGKFYATAEGLGTMNSKLVWLSGRIDAALEAGDSAALEDAARDVAHSHEEVQKVERVALELGREMPPFLQMAEQSQVNGLSSCE